MVVILTGAAGSGGTLGRALADELGWRFEEASPPRNEGDRDHWAAHLHALVARAVDRREPLVVVCPTLEPRHLDVLQGDLRQVRFVHLARDPARERPFDTVTIDGNHQAAMMIAEIRRELGI
ncbi:MAG TPA: hypothetical protein VF219_10020 [Vicinamibacterales bacterium]